MRFRGKSIRRKIVGLLLVPLVSLTSIWAFATVITGREAMQLLDSAHVMDKVGKPAQDTVHMLQAERRQTLVYLADPRRSDGLARLHRQESHTDEVAKRFRSDVAADDVADPLRSAPGNRLDDVLSGLRGLDTLRRKVEEGTVTRTYAFAAYNAIIDPAFDFLNVVHTIDDAEMDKQGHALVVMARAREVLSREDALLASGLVADRMSDRDVRSFSDLVAGRKVLYSTSLSALPQEDGAVFEKFWNGPDTVDLRSAEERVVGASPGHALEGLTTRQWQSAAGTVLDRLDRMGEEASMRHHDRVQPVAVAVVVKAAVAGVLGFAAVVVSLVVSARIGRGLVRDLTRLRKEAHEVSGVRLPSVMRRLAAGDPVDVETEAPRLEYGPDEMGQVGLALNTLQRAAVEAAVRQAQLRRGVSEVFVNLARRSQVLLHRQLTLLDTMERRTEDTEELADLFRLDHLTTRMRRHAEGLVILSGAAPSRQWRKPIQLMDVVRAAVSEVEDYERIEVRRLPRLSVTGPAVADLTHLLAELLENATVFSPPHTAVQVLGERVGNGFTLEIHDRGLGMTPDALLDANLRLAETPEFELSDTDRLGLFVVSRLARRLGVRVSLQTSPYGGTTAVVFIPTALLTEAPGRSGASSGEQAAEETGEFEVPGRSAGAAGKFAALAQSPVPMPRAEGPKQPIDGPVELEAPVSAIYRDRDEAGGRGGQGEDEESSVFGSRPGEREGWRRRTPDPQQTGAKTQASAQDQHQHVHDGPGSGGHKASGEGHRPAGDGGEGETARPGGPTPLPRRRSPVLVSDHGRPVDAGDRRGGPRRRTESRERSEVQERPTTEEPPADTARARPADPATGPSPATGTAPSGLPRRVRQASLAPQLKADSTRRAGQDSGPADPAPERDAEEVRSRMASLQRGWQRGRAHTDTGEGPGSAGDTAPGTTSEGDGR